MATVGNLIDRVLREWLDSPDSQPTATVTTAALAVAATSVTYDDTLLSPEEEDLLAAGTVVELDRELILVGAVNATTNTISGLKRGWQGTTDAAHLNGAKLTVRPAWPRLTVFDAAADAIVDTWPTLYTIKTSAAITTPTSGTVDAPSDIASPIEFIYKDHNNYLRAGIYLFDHGGKKLQFPDAPGGKTGYLKYKAKASRPTAETDNLPDDTWQQLLCVSAVLYLIGGKDIDAAHQEYLTEQLSAQGFPVSSASRIRRDLIVYRQLLFDQARRRLYTEHQPIVERDGVVQP